MRSISLSTGQVLGLLLSSDDGARTLQATDCVAIAALASGRSVIHVSDVVPLLGALAQLSTAQVDRLTRRLQAGAPSDPVIPRRGDCWHVTSERALTNRVRKIVQSSDVARELDLALARTAGLRGSERHTKSDRGALKRACKAPPGPRTTATTQGSPPPRPQPQPRPQTQPPLPPPPARASAPPEVAPFDATSLLTALTGARVSLLEVDVAVRAHRLAVAEQFEELLALPSMRGVESHPYQLETVRRVLRTFRGRALLADEVGLGKTVEALLVLREYQMRGMARRVLVLTPPALVGQWCGELLSKAGLAAYNTDHSLFRSDPERFWGQEGVFVVSTAMARMERHGEPLKARAWDLVVVDEAHHVRKRGTLAFKLVDSLKTRFLLMLTATPVETKLEELYDLVTLLKPGQFSTLADFRKRYVDPKDPTAPRNHEALRGLLGEVMVRNTRAQCGLKLPPRYVTTVLVDPLPAEKALYDAVLAEFRAHGKEGSSRTVLSTLLLEAGSSPAAVMHTLDNLRQDKSTPREYRVRLSALADQAEQVGGTRKLEALLGLVARPGSQTLVFSRFRQTLAAASAALDAAGVHHVSFHGGVDAAGKKLAVDRFRDGVSVMLATDVGAEGVNLQFCHDLVNLDLPWNPMLLEQRIGRLHRMGQEHEVTVTNLCARGTVEERVLDVLDRRVNLFELVVGEMDMVLGNLADDLDFQERVLALYAGTNSEAEIDAGFDALADELLRARGRYEQTRKLEDALFGKDFTT